MKGRWIPVIIFWALFLASIALYGRFPWLDITWYVALLVILIAFSIYSALRIIRDRTDKPAGSYPRWFKRFAMDEPDEPTEN